MLLGAWVAAMVVVAVGSLLPASSPLLTWLGHLNLTDKQMHFSAYLALAFLPALGFRNGRRGVLLGLSMAVLGMLLEAGQHFSPGRTMDLADVLANDCGVVLGVTAALTVRGILWTVKFAGSGPLSPPQ